MRAEELRQNESTHWIGVMLLGDSEFPCDLATTRAGHKCRQVLDGQQRLLTLRLWMLALIDEHIRQTGNEPAAPKVFARRDVLNTQVHSLNQSDWDNLASQAVLKADSFPHGSDSPLVRNYLYFRYLALRGLEAVVALDEIDIPQRTGEGRLLSEWESESNEPLTPTEISRLLEDSVRLKITILQHDVTDGPVERIFETLNSKNTPLGQYDLFRNFILMQGANSSAQRREIYNSEMREAEQHVLSLTKLDLRQTRDNLDAFFQDLVSVETETNASSSSAARVFQDWWASQSGQDAVEYIHSVLLPAAYSWSTAISAGQRHGIDTNAIWSHIDGRRVRVPEDALRSIWRLENMSRRSFVPVTLVLLTTWASHGDARSDAWLKDSLTLIETFVARSILAAQPSSPFRGTAIQAAAVARKAGDNAPEQLRRWLLKKTPTDKDVLRVMQQSVEQESGHDIPVEERPAKRDIALRVSNSTFCALMDGIACQLEGESNVLPLMLKPSERLTKGKQLQIEHLFPKASGQWIPDIKRWNEDLTRMENRLHSLGNTTVLPFKVNIRVRNHPLRKKQAELKRDGVPNYRVSEDFYSARRWTSKEIDSRTKKLSVAALKFWHL